MSERKRDLLRYLGWMISLGTLNAYFMCSSCFSDVRRASLIIGYSISFWILLWMGNALLSEYISRKIPWEKHSARRLWVGMVSMVLYTSGAVLLITTIFQQFGLIISASNMRITVIISLGVTFTISATLHAREFFKFWRESAVQAEKLKKETAISQYEALKNQVNPHFLFNSLNSLTDLIYQNQDGAARFVKELAEVYRYVLESKGRELVPLEEEWAFCESYLHLEKIRYGDKLRVQAGNLPTQKWVAPLSVQMLLENALKHNIISQEDPLTVEVYAEADYLVVANTLQPRNIVRGSTATGLQNIRERYHFLDPIRPVHIDSGEGKFTVKIPLQTPA
jgi:sensor histidine kinase YesM